MKIEVIDKQLFYRLSDKLIVLTGLILRQNVVGMLDIANCGQIWETSCVKKSCKGKYDYGFAG
jgi:hypothetical protein